MILDVLFYDDSSLTSAKAFLQYNNHQHIFGTLSKLVDADPFTERKKFPNPKITPTQHSNTGFVYLDGREKKLCETTLMTFVFFPFCNFGCCDKHDESESLAITMPTYNNKSKSLSKYMVIDALARQVALFVFHYFRLNWFWVV